MRIVLLLSMFSMSLLTACASGDPVPPPPHAVSSLKAAEARCLFGGRTRDSYDYEVCYRNAPEVQAYERQGRMAGMNIINTNRSPRAYKGRSYPVE